MVLWSYVHATQTHMTTDDCVISWSQNRNKVQGSSWKKDKAVFVFCYGHDACSMLPKTQTLYAPLYQLNTWFCTTCVHYVLYISFSVFSQLASSVISYCHSYTGNRFEEYLWKKWSYVLKFNICMCVFARFRTTYGSKIKFQ